MSAAWTAGPDAMAVQGGVVVSDHLAWCSECQAERPVGLLTEVEGDADPDWEYLVCLVCGCYP